MCSRGEIFNNSNYFLLDSDDGLYVGFFGSCVPHIVIDPIKCGYTWE